MITTESTVSITEIPSRTHGGRVYKFNQRVFADSLTTPTQFVALDDPYTKPIGWDVPKKGKTGPVNRKERRIEASKARSKKNGKRRRIRK